MRLVFSVVLGLALVSTASAQRGHGGGGGVSRGGGGGVSHGSSGGGARMGGFSGGGMRMGSTGGSRAPAFNSGFSRSGVGLNRGGFNRGGINRFGTGVHRVGRQPFRFNNGFRFRGWPFYGYYGYPYYGAGYYYDPFYNDSYYDSSYPSTYASGYTTNGPWVQSYEAPPEAPAYYPQQPVYTEPVPPPPVARSIPTNTTPEYLIAFNDHNIKLVLAYWTEKSNLRYVTTEHEIKTAPLSSVDRDLSMQLNHERRMQFNLPLPASPTGGP